MTQTRWYAATRAGRISKNGPLLRITHSSCAQKGERTKEQEERRKKERERRRREERRKTDRKIRKNKKGDERRENWAFFFNNSRIPMLVRVQNFVNVGDSEDLTKKTKHFDRG